MDECNNFSQGGIIWLVDQIDACHLRAYELKEQVELEIQLQAERKEQAWAQLRAWAQQQESKQQIQEDREHEAERIDLIMPNVQATFVAHPFNNGYDQFLESLEQLFEEELDKDKAEIVPANEVTSWVLEKTLGDIGGYENFILETELTNEHKVFEEMSRKKLLGNIEVILCPFGLCSYSLTIPNNESVQLPTGIGTFMTFHERCGVQKSTDLLLFLYTNSEVGVVRIQYESRQLCNFKVVRSAHLKSTWLLYLLAVLRTHFLVYDWGGSKPPRVEVFRCTGNVFKSARVESYYRFSPKEKSIFTISSHVFDMVATLEDWIYGILINKGLLRYVLQHVLSTLGCLMGYLRVKVKFRECAESLTSSAYYFVLREPAMIYYTDSINSMSKVGVLNVPIDIKEIVRMKWNPGAVHFLVHCYSFASGQSWDTENLDKEVQIVAFDDSGPDITHSTTSPSFPGDARSLEQKGTLIPDIWLTMSGTPILSGSIEVLALLKILGERYRLSCLYWCPDTTNAYLKLPLGHYYNTAWVLSHVGEIYFERDNYLEAKSAHFLLVLLTIIKGGTLAWGISLKKLRIDVNTSLMDLHESQLEELVKVAIKNIYLHLILQDL